MGWRVDENGEPRGGVLVPLVWGDLRRLARWVLDGLARAGETMRGGGR